MSVSAAAMDSPAEAKRGRLSLAQKFAIAFLGLVTAVLAINGAIDMVFTYRDARAQAVRVQQEKADAAAAQVVQFVTEIEQQLGWTTRAEWARISVEQRRYDFIRLMRQAAAITELIHVDGTGREQLKLSRLEPDSVTSSSDLSADPRFTAAIRDKIYYGPVTFRRGSEPYMAIAMAHAGRNAGATLAEVNLKLAWDVVTAIRIGETGYAYITDPAGRLIAHPDMSLVLRNTDLTLLPQVKAALAGEGAASSVDTTTGPDGRAVLSAHAKVPKVGWNVFVELTAAEALGPVWSALYQTLALLALGVVLAGGAGTLLARRMVVPIRELQAGAQRLGEGDLTQRIPVRSGDEIGALALRFNTMAGQIQESQETLERKVEARTAELTESLAFQTATSDVLAVISRSTADAQPVFEAVVQSAAKLFAPWTANISILDDGQLRFLASASTRIGDAEIILSQMATVYPIPFDPDRAPSARAIKERRTLVLTDTAEPGTPEFSRKVQAATGFRSMTFVPLLREGDGIGTIILASREAGQRLTDKQQALVETFADQAVIAIENARLFAEVQARTAELQDALVHQTATSDILRVISSSPTDVTPIFNAIAQSAVQLCNGMYSAVMVLEDGLIQIGGLHNWAGEGGNLALDMFPMRADRDHLTANAIRESRIIHQQNMQHDPDVPVTSREMAIATGYQTLLIVPMVRQGTAVGAIVAAKAEGPFSEKQIGMITTFADQAVIAIQNTRLFNETKEALVHQTGTGRILQVIASSPTDIKPVLQAVAESACDVCDAYDGAVLLKRGGDLVFSAHHGPIPIGIDKWPISRNWTAGRAVIDRATVHVHDLQGPEGEEFPEGRELSIRMGHRTIASVPLLREGESIGAMVVRRREARPFTGKQLALLQTFADQAIIAINNVHLFEEVQAKTRELEASLADLHAAQTRLIQSEKLASLGQLTAGIAHEIKNPLNFVNNFADLSVELVQEIEDAVASAGDTLDPKIKAEVDEVSAMLKGNLAKVVQHGRRADSIVKNMLAHSRESGGELRLVDLNATVDEALNLAYHGARAEKPGFNITLERDYDPKAGQVSLYPQEFTRVLLNLIGNGFHAANKKRLDGAPEGFEPVLSVTTAALPGEIRIKVRDNGTGIPDAVKARIFEPFFTTKPTGEGTGLGLSLSHDIVVKQHGGKLDIATEPGEFTEFTVTLPRKHLSQEVQQ